MSNQISVPSLPAFIERNFEQLMNDFDEFKDKEPVASRGITFDQFANGIYTKLIELHEAQIDADRKRCEFVINIAPISLN